MRLIIDELDAGIYEYLLGELLSVFEKGAKGQLIFTFHNLRSLHLRSITLGGQKEEVFLFIVEGPTYGAFIPNANVVFGDVERLQYGENRIVSKSAPQTIARNDRKQRVLCRYLFQHVFSMRTFLLYEKNRVEK